MNLFKKKKKTVSPKPTISTKVQFKHFVEDKITLAFQSPTSEELLRVTNNLNKGEPGQMVEFKFGYSKVHPKDQYSKKIGREVSTSHLKQSVAVLTEVRQFGGYAHYYFQFDYNNTFTLLLTYGKEVPFLISMNLNE